MQLPYSFYIAMPTAGKRRVEFKLPENSYISNDEGLGLVANTYKAFSTPFLKMNVEWVLYIEDDLFLSPDTFALCEWYIKQGKTNTLCLCNLESGSDEDAIIIKREMIGWGFLMHKSIFEIIKDKWFEPPMWDLSVSSYLNKLGHEYYFPEVSRVRHMGNSGTHVQSESTNNHLQKGVKLPIKTHFNYYFKINE